jgi:hypothetical protein
MLNEASGVHRMTVEGAPSYCCCQGGGGTDRDKGVRYAAPEIDLQALRVFKEGTVKNLTHGLSRMAAARRVTLIRGTAKFVAADQLEITTLEGETQQVECGPCVIATGSSAVKLRCFRTMRRPYPGTWQLFRREECAQCRLHGSRDRLGGHDERRSRRY